MWIFQGYTRFRFAALAVLIFMFSVDLVAAAPPPPAPPNPGFGLAQFTVFDTMPNLYRAKCTPFIIAVNPGPPPTLVKQYIGPTLSINFNQAPLTYGTFLMGYDNWLYLTAPTGDKWEIQFQKQNPFFFFWQDIGLPGEVTF